jgi:hypothetical protein
MTLRRLRRLLLLLRSHHHHRPFATQKRLDRIHNIFPMDTIFIQVTFLHRHSHLQ